jgi:uncharacterized protein YdeI (YjbR/CyaY-like superfamily)
VKSIRTELEIITVKHRRAWETWIAKHHQTTPGVWIQMAKKGSGVVTVSYDEALDVALCYGWIDNQVRRCDERTYLLKFVPRGPKSAWSKGNRVRALALTKAGRMQPAGRATIETAKRDGRWEVATERAGRASPAQR